MESQGEPSRKTSTGRNSGITRQIYSSMILAAVSCHAGMIGGWLSPVSLELLKPDSPVEQMTKDEIALMGSLPSYVGVVIAFLMAYVAKKFGRKPPVYVAGISGIVSGAIITFAPTKLYLYMGRTLASVCTGAISVVLMLTAELVQDSIRGTMLSFTTLVLNGGILLSYIFGSLLSYRVYNDIFIALPVTYTVLFLRVPESPHFLVEKSRMEDAKKSLLWLRGGDHLLAELELDKIVAASEGHEQMGFWNTLKTKSTRLALIISAGCFAFQALSGVHAILNYSGLIFEEAGSFLSPDKCSIITGALLTGACAINVLLIDGVGRKPLLYVSFIGGAITLSVLSAFLYMKMNGTDVKEYRWIPIGSLSTFMVAYGIGVTAVPGAVANEISPTSIRPWVNAAIAIVYLTTQSAVIQSFPFLDDNVGLYSVFAIPAGFNALATIFTVFMVPETRGKTFVEIEAELNNW